ERSPGREGADVQLEHDRLLPRPPAPARRAPRIGAVIDHLARAADIVRLERRGRVGHVELAVDAEAVARTGADARDDELMPAVRARRHWDRPIEDELHRARSRCPEPKRHAVYGQLRPEPKAAHAAPANTRTARGGALASLPEACTSGSAVAAAL